MLTRLQRKEDFYHVVSMIEIVPEDDAHKLPMKETKIGERDVNTLLTEKSEVLKSTSSKDSDGHTITLGTWEVNESLTLGCVQR